MFAPFSDRERIPVSGWNSFQACSLQLLHIPVTRPVNMPSPNGTFSPASGNQGFDPKHFPDAIQVFILINMFQHFPSLNFNFLHLFNVGHNKGWKRPFRPVLYERQRQTPSLGHHKLRNSRWRKRQSPFYSLIHVQVNNNKCFPNCLIYFFHLSITFIFPSTAFQNCQKCWKSLACHWASLSRHLPDWKKMNSVRPLSILAWKGQSVATDVKRSWAPS